MRKRIAAGLVAVAAGIAVVAAGAGPAAAQPKAAPKTDGPPPPKYLYAHDFKVRAGGDKDWVKAAKVGVEWFQYETPGTADKKGVPFTLAVTDTGAVAALPAGPVGADKTNKWLSGNDVKVRKAGEPEFTQKTKAWGVELFRDLGSDKLVYLSEAGAIAFAPVPANLATDKGPKWHHALEPKVRAVDQDSFKDAKPVGLEVFTDENTGGLLYVAEAGSISAAGPAPAADPKKPLGWKAAYGLILKARKADEGDFSDKTKQVPVEVITDEATGNFVYVTHGGSIAVVPNPGKLADVTGPAALSWATALVVPVRKGGEKGFDKVNKFRVEVFRDNRSGNLIFVSETGAIAVLPK